MSYGLHPANLALRFLLELGALWGMGRFGWHASVGPLRYALCLLLPVLAAAAWGTFAVPGDPSRSGNAPVAVPGWARLVLEATFFGLGAYAYASTGARGVALALSGVASLHYLTSMDRIRWLLAR